MYVRCGIMTLSDLYETKRNNDGCNDSKHHPNEYNMYYVLFNVELNGRRYGAMFFNTEINMYLTVKQFYYNQVKLRVTHDSLKPAMRNKI